MKFVSLILVTGIASISATVGTAETNTLVMQLRLKQDGFYQDDIDGTNGPMTRAAIAEYAEKYGVAAEFDAVRSQMLEVARSERQQLTDLQREIAIEGVKADLKDRYSADVKTHFGYFAPRGLFIACGEVNAKNIYGAYTGFQWFTIPLAVSIPDTYRALSPMLDDSAEAAELCLLGTSWAAALD